MNEKKPIFSAVEIGVRFEEETVEFLNSLGLRAVRTNKANEYDPPQYKAGFDGGVDVIARYSTTDADVYKDFTFYIQCKYQKHDLTKTAIADVVTGMKIRKATAPNCIGVVMTNADVTAETRLYAKEAGVEIFQKVHNHIVLDARDKQGYKIPYGKYGIFMKVLLYQVTKNKYWLEALPDYQGKVDDATQLEKLIKQSELDFDKAQSILDDANKYERKVMELRQRSLDIQKNATLRALTATDTLKTKRDRQTKNDTIADDG